MSDFRFQPILEFSSDKTEYFLLSKEGISVDKFKNQEYLFIEPKAISLLAERAFDDVSHLLRTNHLKSLERILKDPESSNNDIFVAHELLRNAVIAAEGVFPSCQDTGTAIIFAKKGEQVQSGGEDAEALSLGVFNSYRKKNLRYSQLAPISMFEEVNTKTNLPAQIDVYSSKGQEYHFLFVAKGGGSANKSFLFHKSKALLNPKSFEEFVRTEILKLGTTACPPYHLALVVGGTSAEDNLKTLKLASCGYLDNLPTSGNELGRAFRDLEMEKKVDLWAQETKIGAQFGGKYFVHDVRVIRMPRHGASCPVSLGVSCSADRNIKGKINSQGIFLEKLEVNPAQFLPTHHIERDKKATEINLNTSMPEILKVLSALKVSTRIMLSGPMIVARDTAHAKLKERIDRGEPLPEYLKKFPIYYAGPAKKPEGHASGSFGPTTSQRMDPYVPLLQSLGVSLIMLGKGNRTAEVTESCKKFGGFYLGSIGGPAALLGRDCITNVEVIDYAELGMEAIWKIEVKDFPAFIIIDDKGNDFYKSIR